MATIYIIKNRINDKVYIGQCMCDVSERFYSHTHSKDNIPLHKAMQELGVDNFYYEVIDVCSDDLRLAVETYYIDKYNSLIPNGYNFYRHSSEGFSNKTHSAESILKISQASKMWWKRATEEQILARNHKISEHSRGKKFSVEHRKKLSEIAKQRVGEKNSFYGRKHTKESIDKMRKARSKRTYHRLDADNNVLQSYDTIEDASCWILSNNLTNAKKQSIQYRIYATVEGRQQTAYGYKWSSSECNDYPIGDEISQ